MKEKAKWYHVVFIIGIAATIIGAIDPLEGSIVIAIGGICLAVATYFMNDRYFKFFLVGAIMILFGVSALWFISSLGGYEPKKEWWWNVFISPYPLGWLVNIITLMVRWVKGEKREERLENREERLETGD